MINKIRTLFGLLMVAGAATMFVSVDAYASNHDPHQEEKDGCDHGATGKECKPDPSPKGKDCDPHGKHGGVNEDHCTTTTSAPIVTVPTVPGVTTPTVPGVTTPTVPGVTTPTVPVVPDAPVDPDAPLNEDGTPRTAAPPADDLATTGTSSEALAVFGAGMLLLGTGIRKLVKVTN